MDIRTLIQQLRQPGARSGIGVWLLPRQYIGQEEILAVRLDLHALDARQAYLERLPAGARFSGLTRPNGHYKLLDLVHALASGIYPRNCLLVHTLDLLLLGMEVDERERFWRSVLEGFPYPRTKLVLTVPDGASELLSHEVKRSYIVRIAEGGLE